MNYLLMLTHVAIFSMCLDGADFDVPKKPEPLVFRSTLGQIIDEEYPTSFIKLVLSSVRFAALVYNQEQAARNLNADFEQRTRDLSTTPVLCLVHETIKKETEYRHRCLDREYNDIRKTPFVIKLLNLVPECHHVIIKNSIMKPLLGLKEFRPHEPRYAAISDPSEITLYGEYSQILGRLYFMEALDFLRKTRVHEEIGSRSTLVHALQDRYAKDRAILDELIKNLVCEEIREELIKNFEEAWGDHILRAGFLLMGEPDIAEIINAIKKTTNTRALFSVLLGIPMGTDKPISPRKITDASVLHSYSYFFAQ